MATGEIPADEAAVREDASDVATLAGMITEGFIPNSAGHGQRCIAGGLDQHRRFPAEGRRFPECRGTRSRPPRRSKASKPRRAWCRPSVNRAAVAIARIGAAKKSKRRPQRSARTAALEPPFAFLAVRRLLQRAFALKAGAVAGAHLELHLLGVAQHVQRHVDAGAP